MTVREWGGRAMCPADEYDDPAIREEMLWHAVEEAFADAGRDPRTEAVLGLRLRLELLAYGGVRVGREAYFTEDGYMLIVRASTDSHLGEDASGLVDVTCTLTPA